MPPISWSAALEDGPGVGREEPQRSPQQQRHRLPPASGLHDSGTGDNDMRLRASDYLEQREIDHATTGRANHR
jgi:hypothetical protein